MQTTKRTIYPVEGLRAIAVLAVIAFHLWPSTIPGGFLGVDLFFVISGYVITALLADQVRSTGQVNFKAFYRARARRLLPAMAAVVGIALALAAVAAPDLKNRALGDLAFIFTSTYNWHLAIDQRSYFDQWAPPIFQHLWSLSVEGQFYMLWPLILFGLTWRFTSNHITKIMGLSALALSAWLIVGDLTAQSAVNSGYFQTQIHFVSLLAGSALGLSWRPEVLSPFISTQASRAINTTSAIAALALAALFVFADSDSGRSIFALMALVGALLIATAVHPASRSFYLLSHPALIAIGRRSYSLYLWHWPMTVLIPQSTMHSFLVITTTVGLSELTFRYVEEPFRTRRFWAINHVPRLRIAPAVPSALLLVGVIAASAISPTTTAPAVGVPSTVNLIDGGSSDDSTVPPPTTAPSTIESSVFIGDSVLLGIRSAVPDSYNLRVFDGVVGRQAPEILAALKGVSPNLHSGLVVVNLGNNGRLSSGTTRWIFENLNRYEHAVIINSHVPRSWQDPNNELIQTMAAKYPRVKVADWADAADGNPDYFGRDGVHLTPKGVSAYFAVIDQAIAR